MTESVARPLRRDAERNRQRILRAASEVFAHRGLGVSLDDVAAHAGLGVGTVYRRFASKADLVDALFDRRMAENAALAEAVVNHPEPGTALRRLLGDLVALNARDRGLRDVMLGSASGHPGLERSVYRLHTAIGRLLARARTEGRIRPELAPTDVPVLLVMMAALAEFGGSVDPELWHRYLPMVLDGLWADGSPATPLTHPPLDPDSLERAMAARFESPQITRARPVSTSPAPL